MDGAERADGLIGASVGVHHVRVVMGRAE
jgi:hypothetical protein